MSQSESNEYFVLRPGRTFKVTAMLLEAHGLTLECNCGVGGLCDHELDVLRKALEVVDRGDPYISDILRRLPPAALSALGDCTPGIGSFDRSQIQDRIEKALVAAGIVHARFINPPQTDEIDTEN